MNKLLVSVMLFFLIKTGAAQYTLNFCEDVNNDGKPLMISNSFMVDTSGGLVKFYLKADKNFNTSAMEFRIYYLDRSGKEEEIERLSQRVEPSWDYIWKELAFFDPGTYRVKVYNGNSTYLTSANLLIRKR